MENLYALIEFNVSKDVEIVHVSTLRGVNGVIAADSEAICEWKEKGKKKTTCHAVKVLRTASMFYDACYSAVYLLLMRSP